MKTTTITFTVSSLILGTLFFAYRPMDRKPRGMISLRAPLLRPWVRAIKAFCCNEMSAQSQVSPTTTKETQKRTACSTIAIENADGSRFWETRAC